MHASLKALLKQRGVAELGARACTSSCLDTCWVGPCIAVEPDDFIYGRVTVADVPEIVADLEKNVRVERLVLAPDDFIEPPELRRRE